MKKILTFIFAFVIAICVSAKTRYVASHYESIKVETIDSTGVVIDSLSSFDESRYSVLCKTINDLQFSVFSLNVSEEESKGIKRAKNAQGWAMAASISSAVSYGLNRGMAIGTRGFRSLHYGFRAFNSAITLQYSLYGLERASAALAKLQSFEGLAFVVYNPTAQVKTIIVNNMNISVMPMSDYPILITKNKPVIIGIQRENKQFSKVIITADRLVYKMGYDFEYNGKYYSRKNGKYLVSDIDNPNDCVEISEENFKLTKKDSKNYVEVSKEETTENIPDSVNITVYTYSHNIHTSIHCKSIKNPEKAKEVTILCKKDYKKLTDSKWLCKYCFNNEETLPFKKFIMYTNNISESKALINN